MSRGEDADWFLSGSFYAASDKLNEPISVRIRQVPGNGSCLFLSIAAGILYNESLEDGIKKHPNMAELQQL